MYKKSLFTYSVLIIICSLCLVFAPGCKQENDNKAYQGVGRLVAERHRARLAQSAEKKGRYTARGQERGKYTSALADQTTPEPTILEKKVNIVDASSGKILAKATAYLDRDGKIINITTNQD